VASQLAQENAHLTEEVRTLAERVTHMNEIVQSHRALTAASEGPVEQAPLGQIAGGALAIVDASYARLRIEVVRSFDDVPAWTDRVKLTQVLVNLLSNAKDACVEMRDHDRRVCVRVRNSGGDKAIIEVEDNGIGIAAENLDRIFADGFTTKGGGRGLGLHYCANALKEMGGRLSVRSEGPGKGAAFTVEIPKDRRSKPRGRGEIAHQVEGHAGSVTEERQDERRGQERD
jgi:C4-dicarboxylate-specific signal transduction histidine kinase